MLALLVLQEEASSNATEVNGKRYVWGVRTEALGALVTLTGQVAEEYHLVRIADPSDSGALVWAVGTRAAETKAVGQFHGWWKKAYKGFAGAKAPGDHPPKVEKEEKEVGNIEDPVPATAPVEQP